MEKQRVLLIFDTGDLIFDSKAEAMKFAVGLKKRGHKLDRIQTHGNLYEGDFKPRILHDYKKKRK